MAKFLKSKQTGEGRCQLKGMQLLRKWNERMEEEGKPEMMFNLRHVTTRVKRRQGKSKPSRKDMEKGQRLEAVWGV